MVLTRPHTKTDREIQQDVLAELGRDWRFKPAEIGVEVDDAVVTLTGTVSSYKKITDAAEVATRVAGVKDIANELRVEGGSQGEDTKIAQAVRNALLWDVDVPEERIDSVVRDGVVTLTGTVEHWSQRKAAYDTVARLSGVKSVRNDLNIAPTLRTDQQIFDEIKATLRRRLPLEDIEVTIDRGGVTLMGRVASYPSRSEAEHAAWTTGGVKSVLNKIVVSS